MFAKNLKMKRQEKFSQKEFAEKLNINQSAVSKWENGQLEPSLEMLIKICQVLQIDINELLGITPSNEDDIANEEIIELIDLLKNLSEEELTAYLNLLKLRHKDK